jgi:hypothetical protein
VGGAQKGAGAHGQATCAVSTVRAQMWISSGCGEDGADKAGPHEVRASERADKRFAALMRRARNVERGRGTRERSLRRQVGPTEQRERGSESVQRGLSLTGGTHLSGGAGTRPRLG